jgi:hypothetical protein
MIRRVRGQVKILPGMGGVEEDRDVTLIRGLRPLLPGAPVGCGDLDGDRVWMTCTCGAVINRSADDD